MGIFTGQAIGNLGRDAEARDVFGQFVINFSIAVNRAYKDKAGNKIDRVEWIECELWRNNYQAILPHLKKGTVIYIAGDIFSKMYTNKDGIKVASIRMKVQSLSFVSAPANSAPQANVATNTVPQKPINHVENPEQYASNVNESQQNHGQEPETKAAKQDDYDDLPF